MMNTDDVMTGVFKAQYELYQALRSIKSNMPPDQALAIAEKARIDADHAYRKAIGAACEDCGGNTEQHVGNS